MEFVLGILAAGLAVALTVTVAGLAFLGLLIWGGITLVNRITGKSRKQKNLPTNHVPPAQHRVGQGSVTYEIPNGGGSVNVSSGSVTSQASMPRDYEYLDVDDGATFETVTKAMSAYEGAPYVGEFARSVVTTLDRAEFRRKSLLVSINREFDSNTITWDKFAVPVDVAMDGILRNCAQIGNRVQGFDVPEYERLSRLVKAGACEEGSSNKNRWYLLESTIKEMRELRQANDELLFELEKLQGEIDRLSDKDDEPTDDILEEIRKLSEEAKYYS